MLKIRIKKILSQQNIWKKNITNREVSAAVGKVELAKIQWTSKYFFGKVDVSKKIQNIF